MWWGGRPRHCLKIGPDALVWAQFGHGWTGRRHDRCVVRPLDPDLIRVSPTELNVLQSGTIQEQLRLMTAPSRGSRLTGRRGSGFPIPIVLLLPDVCVRTAVFELDRVPRRREEREALVRWRFGQDHLFPLTEAKVVYQLLSGEGSNDSGSGRAFWRQRCIRRSSNSTKRSASRFSCYRLRSRRRRFNCATCG